MTSDGAARRLLQYIMLADRRGGILVPDTAAVDAKRELLALELARLTSGDRVELRRRSLADLRAELLELVNLGGRKVQVR